MELARTRDFNIRLYSILLLVVLNEKQRVAKRKLIDDNRQRRRSEETKVRIRDDSSINDYLTEEDRSLLVEIVRSYDISSYKHTNKFDLVSNVIL